MKIDVKIYDVGAIPDKKALAHTLQVAFADLKATWISSNELVPGSSLNNSLKRLESLFTTAVEVFIESSVVDGFGKAHRSDKVEMTLPGSPISSHRYLPVVMAVCDEISKGFHSYPPRYKGAQTKMRLVVVFSAEELILPFLDIISSCFVAPNRGQLEEQIRTALLHTNIESGILLIATGIPDTFHPDRHTISAAGAQQWAIKAFEAGENGASELGWEPVRSGHYMPHTHSL